jgi:hypothetical protein
MLAALDGNLLVGVTEASRVQLPKHSICRHTSMLEIRRHTKMRDYNICSTGYAANQQVSKQECE